MRKLFFAAITLTLLTVFINPAPAQDAPPITTEIVYGQPYKWTPVYTGETALLVSEVEVQAPDTFATQVEKDSTVTALEQALELATDSVIRESLQKAIDLIKNRPVKGTEAEGWFNWIYALLVVVVGLVIYLINYFRKRNK